MKGLAVFLLAAITMGVTARHRKEWQRIDPARAARERFQPFYKSEACKRGAGFYRDPQDCHQYIRCVDEFGSGRHFSVFAGRCEPGLVFDENVSACNWPELAAPCSNSPEKLQLAGSGFVVQENAIPEETNREKPYPVQQQVVQDPKEPGGYKPQRQEVWEIQVVHPQEGSDAYEPEVTWQQVAQTTLSQTYDQQQHEVSWQDKPVYQEQQSFPQQQQEPVNQQQFQQNAEVHSEDGPRQQQQEAEPAYGSGKKNPNSQQKPSGAFQEIGENPQHEISAPVEQEQAPLAQESQSRWWVPDNSPQHNPPDVAEQIPASGDEPVLCEKEGFFRHPDNCSQFIRCVKLESAFSVHVFECPKQLVFSEKDSSCVVDDAQSCRTVIRKKRQAPAAQLKCPGEGFFRHPKDCRAFYRCAKTESGSYETHPFSCPSMLVFDEEYTTCNFPEKAPPCNQQLQNRRKPQQTQKPYKQIRTTRKPTNDFIDKAITEARYGARRTAKPKTTPAYGSSPKCRSEGFYSNKNDCTKFYKCVKRGDRYIRYDLNCPNNYGFDDRSKRCIAQRYVASCSRNKLSNNPPRQADEETTTSTEAPATSSSSPSDSSGEEIVCEKEGYFRHPKDCNKFYRCVDFEGNGQEFVRYDFDCPEGLIFDEANSVCNWPDPNAPCEARSGGSGGNEGTGEGGNEGTGEGGNEGTGEGGNEETGEGGNEGTGEGGNEGTGEGGNEGTGEGGNEGTGEGGNEGTGEGGNEGTGAGGDEGTGAGGNEGTGAGGDEGTGGGGSDNEPGSDGQDGTGSEPTETTSEASGNEIGEGQGGGNEAGTGGSGGECTKEGFYRNPEDCNKFYRCVDFDGEGKEFVRYDFNCPDGLVFDEVNSVCNWPSESEPCDAKAGGGSESGGGSGGSPGSGSESGGGSDGSPGSGNESGGGSDGSETTTSDKGPEDGSQAGGDQDGSETTSGQTDVQGSTDAPEASQSTPSSPAESSSQDDSDQQGGPSEPSEGTGGNENRGECTEAGFFRNPDDCNKFYRCVDQNGDGKELVRYDFACPEGLVFDETNSVCNWPEQSAPCDGSSSGGGSTPSGGGDGSDSSQPADGSDASQPSDGSDSSQPSDGGEASQTTSGSDGTSQTTASGADSSSGEAAGESSTQSTGEDKTTESPDNGQESGSTSESTGSAGGDGESTSDSSGGGSSGNTGECTEEGFFRNPEDCNKFYRCVDFNGDGQQFVRYDFDCPEGLVFDEVNSVCNWPDQTPRCETKGGSDGKETTSGGEATSPAESSTTQSSDSTEQPAESTSQQSTQSTGEQSTQGAGEQTTQGAGEQSTQGSGDQSTQTTAGASSQATTGGSESTSEQTSTQASTSKRPSSGDSSCSEPGFFRCEDDCSKFYRCVEEGDRLVRYDFHCPEGLVFDDQNKRCDWPSDLFACDSGSTTGTGSSGTTGSTSSGTSGTTTSESTSTAPTSESTTATSTASATSQASTTAQTSTTSSGTSSSEKECTEEGYFRHPDDCSKYYRCIDEGDGTFTREEFACAEDEVFDEEMRYCNRKDLAPPCDGSETTSSQSQTTSSSSEGTSNESQGTTERTTSQPSESTTASTTQASSESTSSSTTSDSFECREPGFFRCPEDCTKFYRCVRNENGNLVRYDFYCPDGLIFDAQKEKCDFPSSELTCDEQSSTTATQSGSQTPSESTSGSQTPSESTSGSQTTSESTSGSSDATTSSDRTTSGGTTSASSGATDAEGCTEEGYFRNPEDCSKYYRCIDEGDGSLTREDFACEEDEVFDEEMNYCNRKDLAPPCDGTSSSTAEGSTGSTQPSSEQSTAGSSMQEPESTTSAGSTGGSSQQEPESTTGSAGPTTGSSEQEPESTTASSGSSSSTGSSGQGSGECEEEGFHRDPNDCNKFYRCVDFRGDGQSYTRYDFVCPEGLVFDETVDVCNWPSSVPSCESSGSGGERGSTSSGGSSSSSSTSGDQTTSTSGEGSQTTSQAGSTSQPSTGGAGSTTPSSGSEGESTSSGASTTSGGGTGSSGGSSSEIECTEEGFFRHPEDCGKFYRCVDFAGTGESYVRYDFDCPEGLVFDEINSVCNWPNQSPRCESGSKGSSGGDKGTGSSGSTPGEGTGYENTSGSTGSEESTTSSSDGGSTTPGDQSTGGSSDGVGTTSSSSDGFRCEEEGYYKHPTDCKKYYECKRDEETGELVKIDCECPDGHVWDNEGWYCNAEELSPPCEGSGSSFRCTEEGFFRDPEDCTRYYRCERAGDNGFRSERFQCDEGLVFDEEGRYCNAPELSEPCDGSSSATTKGTETTGSDASGTSSTQEASTAGPGASDSTGSSSESTGSGTSTSGECTREGFFRNPEDCTKYYRCSINEDTGEFDRNDYSCTEGRIFDEQSNYCNEPELSEEPCDTASGGSSTTTQSSSGGATSSTSGGSGSGGTGNRASGGGPQCAQEGFFRHPDDCNKFYRCVDFSGSGESYVRYDFDCPEGLHFDEVNSVCNWPTMTPPCQPGNQLFRQYLGRIN